MMAATIQEVDEHSMTPPPPYQLTAEKKELEKQPSNSLTVPGLSTVQSLSPRPHKKSEIRALLDSTNAVADDHKPEWMMFSLSNLHSESPRPRKYQQQNSQTFKY